MPKKHYRLKHIWKILVLILGLIIGIGGAYLHHATYRPTTTAQQAVRSAHTTKDVTTFKAKHSRLTVVFYPGALVQPASYAPWAQQVAQAGYTVKIVHFPLNLAVLAPNKVHEVIGSDENYVLGGHSLGGAMAARYAHHQHNPHLKGVFFLAAYADQKGRLDHSGLPVLNITGNRDGVLHWDKYSNNKKYLPTTTQFVTIPGGNHSGFGSYGLQKGDRSATISNQEQQVQIAHTLTAWLHELPTTQTK